MKASSRTPLAILPSAFARPSCPQASTSGRYPARPLTVTVLTRAASTSLCVRCAETGSANTRTLSRRITLPDQLAQLISHSAPSTFEIRRWSETKSTDCVPSAFRALHGGTRSLYGGRCAHTVLTRLCSCVDGSSHALSESLNERRRTPTSPSRRSAAHPAEQQIQHPHSQRQPNRQPDGKQSQDVWR